jgi:hypothetical protein
MAIGALGSKFVAVDYTGATVFSTDGATWTAGATLSSYGVSTLYSDGTQLLIPSATESKLFNTTNGSTFSTVTLPATDVWSTLAYSGSKYIVASGATAATLTSADGASWSAGPTIGSGFDGVHTIVWQSAGAAPTTVDLILPRMTAYGLKYPTGRAAISLGSMLITGAYQPVVKFWKNLRGANESSS